MKPKITLISYTKDPIPLMCWVRRVMHSPVPDTIAELKEDPEKWLGCSIDEYFENTILKDGMPTFLEYVGTVWKFENVSRALTHQLVRHRMGFSYSQQSMRVVPKEDFADKKLYRLPPHEDPQKYHNSMLIIQKEYNKALQNGMAPQDARGLLPINILTTITFAANLRALIGMINKRLCFYTQDEFRGVANQVVTEVDKIDSRLLRFFGAPCKMYGKCMAEGENLARKGTSDICPTFVKLFLGEE